jgi:putative ABC transport system substrate-binding protein
MKRRDFITILGGAAAPSILWPLVARAQQPLREKRIGVLIGFAEADPEAQARLSALRQGLQELGWNDGRTIRIDYRFYTTTDRANIRALAAQLVDLPAGFSRARSRQTCRCSSRRPSIWPSTSRPQRRWA